MFSTLFLVLGALGIYAYVNSPKPTFAQEAAREYFMGRQVDQNYHMTIFVIIFCLIAGLVLALMGLYLKDKK